MNQLNWLPIHGTNGWPPDPSREWWYPGDQRRPPAPFVRFLRCEGWHFWDPADPFVWSTDVNGVDLLPWRRHHRDWRAGGKALRWRLRDVPCAPGTRRRQIVLFAHSYGLNVALEALGEDVPDALEVCGLVSIGSPIRADMADVARRARRRIGYWLHIGANLDLWRRLGQVFDGDVNMRGRWPAGFPRPDVEVQLPGFGAAVHGEILRRQERFYLWRSQGWLEQMRQAVAACQAAPGAAPTAGVS